MLVRLNRHKGPLHCPTHPLPSRPDALDLSEEDLKKIRERMMNSGGEMSEVVMNLSDDQIREVIHQRGLDFRDKAPTSASEATTIILDGVKAEKWRILVAVNAHRLNAVVRSYP